MKRVFAIATLLLATASAVPAEAAQPHSRTTQAQGADIFQSQGTLVADDFSDYRRSRHEQLERQLRQELSQPRYRNISQQEKMRVMKQAHDDLEDVLDREEKRWRNEREYRDDRYDRYDRYDQRYDDRYDRYRRYDQRYDDRYRYDERYRYDRSRYNQRYN